MDQKGNMDAPPPYPGAGIPPQQQQPQPGYAYQAGYGPPPGHYPTAPPSGYTPYGQPPVSVAVIQGQPMRPGVTVVHTSPNIFFGANPVNITCPNCGSQIVTATTTNPGLLSWLICGMCVLFGCWLGCCLIPFCIPECQDVEHTCPNCKALLGTNRRL